MMKFPKMDTDMSDAFAGNFVHKVAELFDEQIREEPTPAEISTLVSSIYKEQWAKNPVYNREDKIKICIKNFVNLQQTRANSDEEFKGTHLEKYSKTELFHGYVDWYNEDDGIIRDWKTSKSPNLTNDMLVQGHIYKYLLKEEGLPVNKVIFEMLYTNDKNRRSQVVKVDGFKITHERLIALKDACETEVFIRRPSFLCNYCPWKMRCDKEVEQEDLWS